MPEFHAVQCCQCSTYQVGANYISKMPCFYSRSGLGSSVSLRLDSCVGATSQECRQIFMSAVWHQAERQAGKVIGCMLEHRCKRLLHMRKWLQEIPIS